MDLNKVMVIGNVTKDPESKTLPSGSQVANVTVATNFTWKDQAGQKQTKAEFHSIVAFRGLAEVISKYVKKGSKVYVEGRVQTRSWDDPSGQKRYKTEIIADNLILLDRAGSTPSGNSEKYAQSAAVDTSTPETIEEINIEDIPF